MNSPPTRRDTQYHWDSGRSRRREWGLPSFHLQQKVEWLFNFIEIGGLFDVGGRGGNFIHVGDR